MNVELQGRRARVKALADVSLSPSGCHTDRAPPLHSSRALGGQALPCVWMQPGSQYPSPLLHIASQLVHAPTHATVCSSPQADVTSISQVYKMGEELGRYMRPPCARHDHFAARTPNHQPVHAPPSHLPPAHNLPPTRHLPSYWCGVGQPQRRWIMCNLLRHRCGL